MSLECEHGQLARSCNICEYEREIAELRARVAELEAERDKLRDDLSGDKAILQSLLDREHEERKDLEAENKGLREALDLVISFIPDGWGMPLGFNQVAQQAREAMRKYGL